MQSVKDFRKPLLQLSGPIIVQELLTSAIGSMDVIMLNFVGQSAISAVSLATQITNILFMFYYGLGTGATMLSSQYYGKGDLEAIEIVEGIAFRIALAISIIMSALTLFIPELLMKIFTNDLELIQQGADYLRVLSVAYLCWGIIEVYLSVLRSVGQVKISMNLNIMAFVLNILLNLVFIFGLFGMPAMGAAGAAVGTSLSRVAELIGCFVVSSKNEIKLDLRYVFVRNKILFHDFCNSALPALGNDIVWGTAFSMYSVILGHLGSDVVAANSIISVVRNLVLVASFGLASGGCILIGQYVGDNKFDEAKLAAKELMRLTLASAVLAAGIIVLAMAPVMHFASLSDQAMSYLRIMFLINIYYVFGPAVNTSLICGVFRGGGDSKFGFKVDTIDMWCYAVPLGLLAAFVFKFPIMWVYFLLCTDEFVKWPWVIGHYFKGKWITNLTRENWEEVS